MSQLSTEQPLAPQQPLTPQQLQAAQLQAAQLQAAQLQAAQLQVAQAQAAAQAAQAQAAQPQAAQQASETRRPGMPEPPSTPRLRIYGHSAFLYWWPVWAVGYLLAILTYLQGQYQEIGANREIFHPNSSLGVIFFMTLFLVILMTNFTVRGMASGMVIMGALLVTLFLAYMGWWDIVLGWFGDLKISMNLGAYFWFSTALFATWVISVFVVDHMTYWQVEPGQVTLNFVFGAGSKSYNTQGMQLEKHRADLFQNWLLGLGSGNMVIYTSGATREKIEVPNVLFVGWKLEAMEQLIAMEPAVPGQ